MPDPILIVTLVATLFNGVVHIITSFFEYKKASVELPSAGSVSMPKLSNFSLSCCSKVEASPRPDHKDGNSDGNTI